MVLSLRVYLEKLRPPLVDGDQLGNKHFLHVAYLLILHQSLNVFLSSHLTIALELKPEDMYFPCCPFIQTFGEQSWRVMEDSLGKRYALHVKLPMLGITKDSFGIIYEFTLESSKRWTSN